LRRSTRISTLSFITLRFVPDFMLPCWGSHGLTDRCRF
jgi:hypothetical protein